MIFIHFIFRVLIKLLICLAELVNSLQSYSFEDRSHVNIISTMREAKNYLSKINSIDFGLHGSSVEPQEILKYFNIF